MLRLQKATMAEILRWAARHPTIEVVGLVWAARGTQYVTPLRNTHRDPVNYYDVDPAELMSAYRHMDSAGGYPIAFYHSHPNGKSDPSETDMMGAMNTGLHYLIAYPEVVASEPALPAKSLWQLSAWECISRHVLVADEYEVRG